MKPFTYLSPRDGGEAIGLLRKHAPDARLIAGGQSLLLAMKDRSARPSVLVSLAGIPELRGIRTDGDEFVVGATTSYAELSRAELPGWQATIAAMAGDLADRPVRTRGTIGGALCEADARFDMLTLVAGVAAKLEVLSADGLRLMAAVDFLAPEGGRRPEAGEILTAIRFPAVSAFDAVIFEKFRQRTFDAALASVLCAVRSDADGRLADARITVGATTPVPVAAVRSTAALIGKHPADVDVASVAEAVVTEVLGSGGDAPSVQYSRELVRALARKALSRALPIPRS